MTVLDREKATVVMFTKKETSKGETEARGVAHKRLLGVDGLSTERKAKAERVETTASTPSFEIGWTKQT